MARAWYSYDQVGPVLDPASYNKSSFAPTCINGSKICALYAPDTGQNPGAFSTNLRAYIGAAGTLAQPSSPTGAKKYLYKFT